MVFEPTEFIAVGQIRGPHGVKGEFKVDVMTDFPQRYLPGSQLWVEGESRPRQVMSARPHQGFLLVQLDGIADRSDAESLRHRHLMVRREEAMALPEDEFYADELIGLEVVTVSGESLGQIEDILWTGANEVYVAHHPDLGEMLIPAIADVVQSIDCQEKKMVIKLLPGLIPQLEDRVDKNHT